MSPRGNEHGYSRGSGEGEERGAGGEGERSRSWHSRCSFRTTPLAPLYHPGQRPHILVPGLYEITSAHGLPHETTTRGKQPDALITVPQPPGLYGPLLHPTSTTGTADLTLDLGEF